MAIDDYPSGYTKLEISGLNCPPATGRKPNCRMTSRKIVPCCEKKMINKEEFLKLAEAKYAEIHALKDEPTFLDYERGFVELWTELGRQVLQSELGDPGVDRRKKKDLDNPGENRAKKD
jgi:hypothetical protein